MKRRLFCLFGITACMMCAAENKETTEARLQGAGETVKEMAGAGDKGVPRDLFAKAQCTVVVPNSKKGGFIVGVKYGKGFASCRVHGGWSAPSGVIMEGGSFGLQAGGAESDIILLVMNESGMKHLMASKFTLGGDATAAAGPVGRDSSAQTDATMHAEILSYNRARGVFAGVSFDGSTLRPDSDANKNLYGSSDPASLLGGKTHAPAGAKFFLQELRAFGGTAKKK